MENELDRMFAGAGDAAAYSKAYSQYMGALLQKLDHAKVATFVDWLLAAREAGRQSLFVGNGGSASTASHFANDLAVGTRSLAKPFRALSLTDNVAVLTAIGNDFGYDEIFSRQLAVTMQPGDLVVVISASGNSTNIIKALEYARAHKGRSVALLGFDGGKAASMADLSIVCHTAKGEYGPVEDLHLILNHIVGTYLMRRVARG